MHTYFDSHGFPANVSRETFAKFDAFAQLLLKWNKSINLIAKNISEKELWERHICDSLVLLEHLPANAKTIMDFGSGGGFPAIILAIATNKQVTMVESDKRKCVFLGEVGRVLGLNINIINKRIEDTKKINTDIITARALAPIDKLLSLTHKFFTGDNFALFLKGENVVKEIEEATENWFFDCELYQNKIGNIIKIRNPARKEVESEPKQS